MATPEVVLAASLLTLFLNLGVDLGFTTIVIAHVMFCISFVVVAVKARIASLDPRLEQAAMDLYANEVQTFRRVTLPLVAPGIAGAALLAFSLSFDDYIITNFTSGDVNTFPKFVYVSAQRGIPAQAYVIGTFMFLLAFVIVVGSELVLRSRRAQGAVWASRWCVDTVDPGALRASGRRRWATAWRRARRLRRPRPRRASAGAAGADAGRGEPVVILQRVPEESAGKNRVHVDLHPPDAEAHIAQLEALGARRVGQRVTELLETEGVWWQAMADPQGTVFCVVADPPPGHAS